MASVEKLNLDSLSEGDLVRATAGLEPQAYKYDFLVIAKGKWPECLLTQTDPHGVVTGPVTAILEGTGLYLTQRENPVQKRPGQITISHGEMHTGGFIIVLDAMLSERVSLMPACSAIDVYDA